MYALDNVDKSGRPVICVFSRQTFIKKCCNILAVDFHLAPMLLLLLSAPAGARGAGGGGEEGPGEDTRDDAPATELQPRAVHLPT